jgi:hypothetical protein
MIEQLRELVGEQPWMECRELTVVAEPEQRWLQGEWVLPYLEGVEPLAYLVSEVALLVQESEEPSLAGARLHAELLPGPAEEAYFPFRIWTDPVPTAAFDGLLFLLIEALHLLEAEGEEGEESGNGFIQIDEL